MRDRDYFLLDVNNFVSGVHERSKYSIKKIFIGNACIQIYP